MDIAHVPGLDNVVADSLFRQYEVDQISADSLAVHAITHILSDIDLDHLAEDQLRDEECATAPMAITNLCWQHCRFPGMRHEVLCDVLLQQPRIYVPVGWRKRMFDALHSLAHPSGKTTLEIISRDYMCHGMKKEVLNWAKICVKCQQNKITRHTKPPTKTILILQDRFTNVLVDLVGPLPKSQGFEYLLTMVDRTTRWPEAIPLEESKAETVTRAFITGWCEHFGVSKFITMDRGVQFTSNLWTQVLEKLGIKASMTTAYHPQSNGMVEHFHRTLKNALRCFFVAFQLVGQDRTLGHARVAQCSKRRYWCFICRNAVRSAIKGSGKLFVIWANKNVRSRWIAYSTLSQQKTHSKSNEWQQVHRKNFHTEGIAQLPICLCARWHEEKLSATSLHRSSPHPGQRFSGRHFPPLNEIRPRQSQCSPPHTSFTLSSMNSQFEYNSLKMYLNLSQYRQPLTTKGYGTHIFHPGNFE